MESADSKFLYYLSMSNYVRVPQTYKEMVAAAVACEQKGWVKEADSGRQDYRSYYLTAAGCEAVGVSDPERLKRLAHIWVVEELLALNKKRPGWLRRIWSGLVGIGG
mgnify:CR=1 FL=1